MRRTLFAVVLALAAAVGCSSTVVLGTLPLETFDMAQPRVDIAFPIVDSGAPLDAGPDALFDLGAGIDFGPPPDLS
jgi:hypothetical protein